jgi:hypothetical protein
MPHAFTFLFQINTFSSDIKIQSDATHFEIKLILENSFKKILDFVTEDEVEVTVGESFHSGQK